MSPAQEEAIRKALSLLIGHFDTAQVFVTHHDFKEDHTATAAAGLGNIFARRAQVEDWLDSTGLQGEAAKQSD